MGSDGGEDEEEGAKALSLVLRGSGRWWGRGNLAWKNGKEPGP